MIPLNMALVADADNGFRQSIETLIAAQGFGVDTAASGAEVVSRIRARQYQVVVADLNLAHIAGLDPLRQIGRTQPEARVILTAAGATRSDVIQALREQTFAIFSKPIAPAAFSEMIGHARTASSWRNDIEILSDLPGWTTLDVCCRFDAAERLVQYVRELERDVSAQDWDPTITAFREILLNAIEHGGHSDPSSKVRVDCIHTTRALVYHITDPGAGFSLESVPHAAISNPGDDFIRHTSVRLEQGLRPGGYGILMARNLVDELLYNQRGNEVILVKYLANAS